MTDGRWPGVGGYLVASVISVAYGRLRGFPVDRPTNRDGVFPAIGYRPTANGINISFLASDQTFGYVNSLIDTALPAKK